MQRVLIDQNTLNAIGFLLDYNWADELADYRAQLEEISTDLDSHHIFARMVEVDNWLRSLNGNDTMTALQHTQIGETK